jgi:hypothetical protein
LVQYYYFLYQFYNISQLIIMYVPSFEQLILIELYLVWIYYLHMYDNFGAIYQCLYLS